MNSYQQEAHNGKDYPFPEFQVHSRGGLSHHPKELSSYRRTVTQFIAVPEQPNRQAVDYQPQVAHAGEVETAPLKAIQIEFPPRIDPFHKSHLPPFLLRLGNDGPSSLQEQQGKEETYAQHQQSTGYSVDGVNGCPVVKVPQM
jgi:hypothetical protein